MRIEQTTIQQISFIYTPYKESLLTSLNRIGLNFPIHVRLSEHGYVCSDGNKRLSAIQDLLKTDPNHPKFQKINIIVDDYARTQPPASFHNLH